MPPLKLTVDKYQDDRYEYVGMEGQELGSKIDVDWDFPTSIKQGQAKVINFETDWSNLKGRGKCKAEVHVYRSDTEELIEENTLDGGWRWWDWTLTDDPESGALPSYGVYADESYDLIVNIKVTVYFGSLSGTGEKVKEQVITVTPTGNGNGNEECTTDSDCPEGYVCSNGYCVPVAEQSIWDKLQDAMMEEYYGFKVWQITGLVFGGVILLDQMSGGKVKDGTTIVLQGGAQ